MTQTHQDPQCIEAAHNIEECFKRILVESMEGIQILNRDLEVEAIEFQKFEDRIIGMILCPWLLSLVILPKEDENWEDQKLGTRSTFPFPQQDLTVMSNEIEGFGICKTYSLYSPVNDFINQEAARIAGALFLRDLLDESKRVEKTYSEEQIQRYLEKEDMVHQEELKKQFSEPVEIKEEVNRRDLIRGKIRKDG